MRLSIQRVTKASNRGSTMKRVPVKRKSVETKSIDSISETISFVIKGKLTSLKPTVLTKRQIKTKNSTDNPKNTKISKGCHKKTKTPLTKYNKRKVGKRDSSLTNVDQITQQGQDLEHISPSKPSGKNKKPKEGSSGSTTKVVKKATTKKLQKHSKTLASADTRGKSLEIHVDSMGNYDDKSPDAINTGEKTCTKKHEKVEQKKVAQEKISHLRNKLKGVNKTKRKVLKNTKKGSYDKEILIRRRIRNKMKKELSSSDELSNNSNEIGLVSLFDERSNVKTENDETSHQGTEKSKTATKQVAKNTKTISKKQQKPSIKTCNPKMFLMKKKMLSREKQDNKISKMKLYGFWNGPKRQRVASLNALAKVHCLYENETRNAFLDDVKKVVNVKKEKDYESRDEENSPPPVRNLRAAPRLGAVGKHWDMHETSSSSDDNESVIEVPKAKPVIKRVKQENETEKTDDSEKSEKKRRRNRTEIIMDLKDMVVRKRMASLNATAILAASYSTEKKSSKSPKSDDTDSSDSDESYMATTKSEYRKKEEDIVKNEDETQVIELRSTPNKKVAVILNQDTDVTITGVYVNSTTRSTHHEGYCSIAGMQYRISATSHTQTAAATMATENILQSPSVSDNNIDGNLSPACKSYTPLGALSNMKPPGAPDGQHSITLGHSPHHLGPPHMVTVGPPHLSPANRRHAGCTSAFSAPPTGHFGTSPGHSVAEQGYAHAHGYYQPAGPLITAPSHVGHPPQQNQPPPLAPTKAAPLSSEPSTSPTPPPSLSHQPATHRPPPPTSATESSDSDVIITSPPVLKESIPPQPPPPVSYRFSQYSSPHHGYSYSYPPQYYPGPLPAPSYPHHDLCYSTPPYLHKAYPTTYRRYLAPSSGAQFFQAAPPDIFNPPQPTANPPGQQMVATNPAVNGSSYQQPPGGHPPSALIDTYAPPTLLDPYPPPAYYSGYGPAPPPSCYTHSAPTRSIPYLNAAYSSCPCPMQSCPKNVHAGPLTGDSKRSVHLSIAKDSLPLPPVALALPLEPVSATGPPSPARGSAGMPPPPSPAGATYQPPPPAPKQESTGTTECKPIEKCRKARVGKNMVRSNIAANFPGNTMLLMCHAPQQNANIANVKREIESPEEKKEEKIEVLDSSGDEINSMETGMSSIENSNVPVKEVQEDNISLSETKELELKQEEKSDKECDEESLEEECQIYEEKEELLPCVKTVAENVKMKNMKRKLSTTKECEKTETSTISPSKKTKIEKLKANGSYKDLIKKHVPCVKINNGKRKLITDDKEILQSKTSKKKRKLIHSNDDTIIKRTKISKPLTSNNQQQVFCKNIKEKGKNASSITCASSELNENTEPGSTKAVKRISKCCATNKKLAPAVLDSLFAKNSVDRTIESVVSNCWDGNISRTNKSSEANAKVSGKVKTVKAAETEQVANGKNTNSKSDQGKQKVQKINSRKKTKCKEEPPIPLAITRPRKSALLPRWSNGWTWAGEPFQAKVFFNSDEATVLRTCYPAMVHVEGDRIEARDCVLLKAGQRKNELPFVAKVAALWENPEDGEMMMSLLWYYRPEHTEQGPQPTDEHDEVFASRHKDTNSVACIEDKCYVLTFNEYCRYRKNMRRLEESIEETKPFVPNPEVYPRTRRQPTNPRTSSDLVFFCRRVYDFRQKRIVKNPS